MLKADDTDASIVLPLFIYNPMYPFSLCICCNLPDSSNQGFIIFVKSTSILRICFIVLTSIILI